MSVVSIISSRRARVARRAPCWRRRMCAARWRRRSCGSRRSTLRRNFSARTAAARRGTQLLSSSLPAPAAMRVAPNSLRRAPRESSAQVVARDGAPNERVDVLGVARVEQRQQQKGCARAHAHRRHASAARAQRRTHWCPGASRMPTAARAGAPAAPPQSSSSPARCGAHSARRPAHAPTTRGTHSSSSSLSLKAMPARTTRFSQRPNTERRAQRRCQLHQIDRRKMKQKRTRAREEVDVLVDGRGRRRRQRGVAVRQAAKLC